MGHPRRMYSAGTVYFVTNRVAEGLPFVPNNYIRLMLLGVIARASNRFEGITICSWLFMANHYHAIVILKGEPAEFAAFMNFVDGEIAKLVVRWLGKRNVRVWAQRYHAAPLLTSDDVLDYMVYLFMNPVKARLVRAASEWAGASTFYALAGDESRSFKRIMPGKVPRLPRRSFSQKLIERLEGGIANSDAEEWELRVDSFGWMECFSNTRGQSRLVMLNRLNEALERAERELDQVGSKVIGMRTLAHSNPHKPFRPRKRGRRVACLSKNWELRRRFLLVYRAFCERAERAWRDASSKNMLPTLPPGAFCAPKPFRCCLLPSFSP